MRKLLNTLYVVTPETYLSLDGENIVLLQRDAEQRRIPLHNIESIVSFGYSGASPALMGECAKRGIALMFMTAGGRFLAQVVGESKGNVLLRKTQYRISDDPSLSCTVARNMVFGKIFNARWVLERALRDHALRVDAERLDSASAYLKQSADSARFCEDLEQLRGFEGRSANRFFDVFDEMILQQKEDFRFERRSRRPPLDRINALLSFLYTLLSQDCAAALSAVGLDPYVGFLHRDRPGRPSLALDLMEELRPALADRLALSLINLRTLSAVDFIEREDGAVFLNDDGRKA
ncbi:MAG: type I-C CRISPR-associated endonuclease Cas1c, partial [Christensenellaceae bacterium]|nr:type I-C CRISPR-associated endonuclease Cas1c [Christensenellaceae bacterium]